MPKDEVPAADVTKLRVKRREIWAWFLEVTIFRVLSSESIALHGLQLPSLCDRQRMVPKVEGQLFAAECLAGQFASSRIHDGTGSSGLGYYIRNVSQNSGSKADFIQSAIPVCALASVNLVAIAPQILCHGCRSGKLRSLRVQGKPKIWIPRARYCPGEPVFMPTQAAPQVALSPAALDAAAVASTPVQPPVTSRAASPDTLAAAVSPPATIAPAASQPAPLASAPSSSALMTPAASPPPELQQQPPSLPAPIAPAPPPHATVEHGAPQHREDPYDKLVAFSGPSASQEALCPAEDEGLKGFHKTFVDCAVQNAEDASVMSALCVTAVSWIGDSVKFKGRAYCPLGLAKSGSAQPPSLRWLKSYVPDLHARLLSSPEFVPGLPCWLAKVPANRRPVSDYLQVSATGGEFRNTANLFLPFRIVKGAFVEVSVLHVLRMNNQAPPPVYGWCMHTVGDPEANLPWNWSLLERLVPAAAQFSPFEVSIRLWAALVQGSDATKRHWTWFSWLEAQIEHKHNTVLSHLIEDNVCVSIRTTSRHCNSPNSKKRKVETCADTSSPGERSKGRKPKKSKTSDKGAAWRGPTSKTSFARKAPHQPQMQPAPCGATPAAPAAVSKEGISSKAATCDQQPAVIDIDFEAGEPSDDEGTKAFTQARRRQAALHFNWDALSYASPL